MQADGAINQIREVASTYGETRDALRSFVSEPTGQCQLDEVVRINVSHSNLKACFVELKFDRHNLIEEVLAKCCYHAGCGSVDTVMLHLYDGIGNQVATLSDMKKKFGFYSPENGWGIHMQDLDPNSMAATGWLENVSLVKKYEISDEAYEKRQGNARAWIRENKAKDPNWTIHTEMMRRKDPNYQPPPPKPENYEEEEALLVQLDSRCEVNPGGRRGEVKFVGKVEGLQPGYWVGVQLDDPLSMSKTKTGVIKGKTYFECPEGYAAWVRPSAVECGDFPNELDELDELGEI